MTDRSTLAEESKVYARSPRTGADGKVHVSFSMFHDLVKPTKVASRLMQAQILLRRRLAMLARPEPHRRRYCTFLKAIDVEGAHFYSASPHMVEVALQSTVALHLTIGAIRACRSGVTACGCRLQSRRSALWLSRGAPAQAHRPPPIVCATTAEDAVEPTSLRLRGVSARKHSERHLR